MIFDNVGGWIIIIVVALILFGGAKKIPDFARNLGRATGEFKRGQVELENEIKNAMYSTPEAPKAKSEVNYAEAARNLGIDPANKTDDQLSQEISERLKTNH
ncbi:MAG: twin-arginine translocase TatA/TatE family subunit [Candidatus Thermoplasmatota archaeon]|jgi:sec-independent protein translocase protein TatA|nr:twin-arginine translocase TatA/TatE family subunit [Candidatus Thermoplasmatota archaeon]MCL5954972.1 twin-arginine translocase TatA/TatE family subunit [Candidatus Thermoplasmatota archaeon]